MQVMLLGFVLLGRSLEESARLKASSDMNELIVSIDLYLINENHFLPYIAGGRR
jgi:hypothetical protein